MSLDSCGYGMTWHTVGFRPSAMTPTGNMAALSSYPTQLQRQLKVSEVCFGCCMVGSQIDERTGHRLFDYAFENGVNLLDSAELYAVPSTPETVGKASEIIGTWLQGKDRTELVIATKVVGRSDSLGWVPANRTVPRGKESPPRVDAKSILAAVDGELRRLNTDYVDILQVHWPERYVPLFGENQYRMEKEYNDATPFEEQIETIGKLIAQGKIRYWGISNETPYGVVKHCTIADALNVPRPITIQNSYSLLNRAFESELAETCSPSNFNLGLLPYCAAGAGTLSGKYSNGRKPNGTRFSVYDGIFERFMKDRSLSAVDEYVRVARDAGMTPIQLAYAYCRSKWFIPSTIIQATNLKQLDENLDAFGLVLGEDILEAIDEIHLRRTNPQNLD